MKSINDLRIIEFDYLVAKDSQVALRYSAEGSHSGEAYKGWLVSIWCTISVYFDLRIGIEPTGRKAKWTAAALFKLDKDGKITLWVLLFYSQ